MTTSIVDDTNGGGALDGPVVTLSGDLSVGESAGVANYTVTLDKAGVQDVVVTLNYADGTALGDGVDYTDGVATLTIPAGELSGNFTVAITDDALSENNEDYTVSLVSTSGAESSLGSSTSVSTTIVDDTDGGALDGPQVTLSGDLSVGESAGVANYTVSLDKAGAQDVMVTLNYADGTALGEGVDYTDGVATLTIPAGELSGSFTVAITDDALSENTEDYTVSLASTLGAESSLGASTSVTTTIVDDTNGGGPLDGPVVTLIGDLSVGESAGVANYTVSLDKAGAQDVVVTLNYADGTALGEGVDYTDGVATLTIPAGQLSGSFTVAISDDDLSENAEDYTVSLASTYGAESSLGSSTSVTTSIVDDTDGGGALDGPVVTLTGDLSVGESAGVANYTVSLDKAGAQDVVVTLNYADGTALGEGVDYTDGVATLTIPAGQLIGSFTVAITDDALSENNEDYTVSLASTLGAESSLGASTSVTTSILDDTDGGGALDGPVVTLTGDLSVGEADGAANYTVILDKAGAEDVVVTLSYADGTALGGGVDYTDGVATLTIPAGQTSANFTVALTNDILSESAENYQVSIASTRGSESSLGGSTQVTTTILDNDDLQSVALNVHEADLSSGSDTASASFGVGTEALVFDLSPAQQAALDALTSDGVSLQYANDGTSITAHTGDPDDPVFRISLNSAEGGSTAEVELFKAIDHPAAQGANWLNTELDVVAKTADGDRVSSQTLEVNFQDATPDQGLSASHNVPVVAEPTYQLMTVLDLSGSMSWIPEADIVAGAGEQSRLDVSKEAIRNMVTEYAQEGDVVFHGIGFSDLGATSQSGSITINKADSNGDVDLTALDSWLNALVAGGGTDYELAANTLNSYLDVHRDEIRADEGRLYFISDGVPLSGNTDPGYLTGLMTNNMQGENADVFDENWSIGITAATSNDSLIAMAGGEASDLLTMTSANQLSDALISTVTPPQVTVSGDAVADNLDLVEGVTINSASIGGQSYSQGDFPLTVQDSDGKAIGQLTLDFSTGAYSFTPSGESLESFVVTYDLIDSDADVSAPATLTFDLSTLTFALSGDGSVAEGNTANYQLTIGGSDIQAGESVTIRIDTLDGVSISSASEGVDYNSADGSLTIRGPHSIGDTIPLTVSTTQDALAEGNEAFVLQISNPSAGTVINADGLPVASSSVETTIMDASELDDLTFTLSGDASVAEGGVANYQITLGGSEILSGESVTIDLNTLDGVSITSATEGVDYNSEDGTLTIKGPLSSGDIVPLTVTTLQDAELEGDEAFRLEISNPSHGAVSGSGVVETTITDASVLDDLTFSLSGDTSVVEGNAASYAITIGGSEILTGESVTVQLDTQDGVSITSATEGVDYNSKDGTLTISGPMSAGDSFDFTVQTTQDAQVEGDEALRVQISNPSKGGISGISTVETTIKDASVLDDLTFSLSGDSSVVEGNQANYAITIGGSEILAGQSVTLDLNTLDGVSITSATEGADYNSEDGTLTISGPKSAGDSFNFTVQTNQDLLLEGDEAFRVQISNPSNGSISGTSTLETSITDDDALQGVTLAVEESGLGTSSDTATGSFVAGTSELTFALTQAQQDALDAITSNGAALQYSNDGTTITAHTGNPADPVFRVSLTSDVAGSSADVELFKPIEHPQVQGENWLGIDLGVEAKNADGDLVGSQTLTVNIQDSIPETLPAESVDLSGINSYSGDLITGSLNLVEGAEIRSTTIDFGVDAEQGVQVRTYVFKNASTLESPNSSLDIYDEKGDKVGEITDEGNGWYSQAIIDDASVNLGTFRINPTTSEYSLTLNDNRSLQEHFNVNYELLDVDGDIVASHLDFDLGSALDRLTYALSGDANVVEGGSASYAITIGGTDILAGESVTIKLDTLDGVSIASATEGVDYSSADQTLTIHGPLSAGDSVPLTVATVDDAFAESPESFQLQISSPSNGTVIDGGGSPVASSAVETTITDDSGSDPQDTVTVKLIAVDSSGNAIGSSTISEVESSFDYSSRTAEIISETDANLIGTSSNEQLLGDKDVAIDEFFDAKEMSDQMVGFDGHDVFISGEGDDAIYGGNQAAGFNASDGLDTVIYRGNFADYSIDMGDHGVNAHINVKDTRYNSALGPDDPANDGVDTYEWGDDLYSVERLLFADGSYVIVDDQLVKEGEQAYYKAILVDHNGDEIAGAAGTVDVTFTDATATLNQDYKASSGQVELNQIFSASSINDAIVDTAETFSVALDANSANITSASYENVTEDTTPVVTTITDASVLSELTFALSGDAAVNEGEFAHYLITIGGSEILAGESITLELVTQDGTSVIATEGVDYNSADQTLTINGPLSAGQTIPVTIKTNTDSWVEGTERYRVRISSPSQGTVLAGMAMVETGINDLNTLNDVALDVQESDLSGASSDSDSASFGVNANDLVFNLAAAELNAITSLTSGGNNLQVSGDGTSTLTIHTGDSNDPVFTVQLNNGEPATVQTTLLKSIEHDSANGENIKALTFTVDAHDTAGVTADSASLTLNIQDWIPDTVAPVSQAVSVNMDTVTYQLVVSLDISESMWWDNGVQFDLLDPSEYATKPHAMKVAIESIHNMVEAYAKEGDVVFHGLTFAGDAGPRSAPITISKSDTPDLSALDSWLNSLTPASYTDYSDAANDLYNYVTGDDGTNGGAGYKSEIGSGEARYYFISDGLPYHGGAVEGPGPDATFDANNTPAALQASMDRVLGGDLFDEHHVLGIMQESVTNYNGSSPSDYLNAMAVGESAQVTQVDWKSSGDLNDTLVDTVGEPLQDLISGTALLPSELIETTSINIVWVSGTGIETSTYTQGAASMTVYTTGGAATGTEIGVLTFDHSTGAYSFRASGESTQDFTLNYEYVDRDGDSVNSSIDFVLNESPGQYQIEVLDQHTIGFDNVLGIYKLDANGQIDTSSIEIILDSQSNMVDAGDVFYKHLKTLDFDDDVGFFLLSDGAGTSFNNGPVSASNLELTRDPGSGEYSATLDGSGSPVATSIFFSHTSFNTDETDHFEFTQNGDGSVTIGIEDVDKVLNPGGYYDNDLNDVVLRLRPIHTNNNLDANDFESNKMVLHGVETEATQENFVIPDYPVSEINSFEVEKFDAGDQLDLRNIMQSYDPGNVANYLELAFNTGSDGVVDTVLTVHTNGTSGTAADDVTVVLDNFDAHAANPGWTEEQALQDLLDNNNLIMQ
ncbi:Calx-beta domain-containing protein [Dongshaea marina]|uniref:Calx-beta domain-containing protein n=1 Tax=Dongshaea marina TaxID=2047966 RepID=UPI000D3E6354|nr:Calx-beta domain-containing protein [Dongshaea marina]